MKRGIISGLALIALGLVSLGAHAQGNWYLGGYYHYVELEDSRNRFPESGAPPGGILDIPGLLILLPSGGAPATTNRFDIEFDSGDGFGLVVGYDFDSMLRSELEVRRYRNSIDTTDGLDASGRMEGISLLANFWFDFLREGIFRPYAGLGVGGTRVKLGDTRDNVISAQVGAGINFAFSERWLVDLGYRYFQANDPRFRSADSRFDSEYAGQSITLGLRYNFGAQPRVVDSDGDGVPDHLDRCPGTPPGVQVDEHGCPLDSDGDGVPDYLDRCPNTPQGVQVDEHGCPIDSDGDGVPDYLDQCPNTPPGEPVTSTGCSVNQSVVLHGVNFEFDRDRLTSSAERVLARVAESLIDSPGFRVELQGHTDSVGSETYNLTLSQRRADSVKAYLMDRGVPANQLVATGYGETRPIADNNSAEGRATNRRVEMLVVDHPPVN